MDEVSFEVEDELIDQEARDIMCAVTNNKFGSQHTVESLINAAHEVQESSVMYYNCFSQRIYGQEVIAVPMYHKGKPDGRYHILHHSDHHRTAFLGVTVFASKEEALQSSLDELYAEIKLFQRLHGQVNFMLQEERDSNSKVA